MPFDEDAVSLFGWNTITGFDTFCAEALATGALRSDDSALAFWAGVELYALFSFVEEPEGADSGAFFSAVDFFSAVACLSRFAVSLAFFRASRHGEASIPLCFS